MIRYSYKMSIYGEVSEWFKVQISKICEGVTLPRVRIPPSPFLLFYFLFFNSFIQRQNQNKYQDTVHFLM